MDFGFINFLFLIPLAIIGLISSYTDIKYGKIFNKLTGLSFLYIFFLYIFLFFYNYLFIKEEENIYYILRLIANGLVAFLAGYLLWHFRLWSAGDAKLFTIYSLLIPLNFYSKNYISYFPSFNLLINLFILLLLVLTANALFTVIKEANSLRYRIKRIKFPSRKNFLKFLFFLSQMFLNYVFVFILLQLLFFLINSFSLSQVLLNPVFLFFLLLLIMGNFNTMRRKKRWLDFIVYGVIIGCGSFLIFSGQLRLLANILKISLVFMVLIGFTRQILDFYIQKKEMQKIKVKDIKEGMIPARNDISLILNKLKEKKEREKFGRLDGGGLTKNQVEIIKNLFRENQEMEIRVYKTLPFAPFLFLAAAISIFTKSSFLPVIDKIFQNLLH